ncbi:MAG: tRNA (adenosine(37)-N6)-dimethylallyltransferase MiaA [Lachnospiraceae bacterium]
MKQENNKKPLIILTGPTAVGKTALSIKLAKRINGEMISADSIQVYKKMNIGSAKISTEEMCGIPHYLIDVLDPKEDFNVVLFKEMALKALDTIYSKNKIPIVVGGTGFYIQALLNDISFEDTKISSYREELEIFVKEQGAHALHERLKDVDPVSYEKIHENNVKRVIRALEFYHDTGMPISKHNEEQSLKKSPYNFIYFVLNDDRQKLYDRIDLRIDEMMEQGLLQEVKELLDYGCTKDMVSMQGLGYKEFIPYFEGKCSLEESVSILKRDTRHFAKRQLTWFRREPSVTWIDKSDYKDEDALLEYMLQIIQDKNILTNLGEEQ